MDKNAQGLLSVLANYMEEGKKPLAKDLAAFIRRNYRDRRVITEVTKTLNPQRAEYQRAALSSTGKETPNVWTGEAPTLEKKTVVEEAIELKPDETEAPEEEEMPDFSGMDDKEILLFFGGVRKLKSWLADKGIDARGTKKSVLEELKKWYAQSQA